MHFLGGMFISLFLVFIFEKYIRPRKDFYAIRNPIYLFILTLLIVSIGWEFYELAIDIYFGTHMVHLLDSLSDICFDLSGGAFGLLYIIKRYTFYRDFPKTSDII